MTKIDLDLIKANSCTVDRCTVSDYGLYYKNIHLSIWFTPRHYLYLHESLGCISISSKKDKEEECIIQSKVLCPKDIMRANHYHAIPVKRKEENIYE